jgi:cytosine/adenosine deaminase-related metal-dependent hydrolase
MYFFENEVAQAAKDLGCRAICGETVMASAPDAAAPYGGLEYCRAFIDRWKGDPLVTPAIAPHAIYTVDEAHLKAVRDLAGREGVPVTMHVAETDDENAGCFRDHGKSPVAYLDGLGMFAEAGRFVAAHCIHVDEADVATLAARAVGVSCNVGSNAKAGKGVAPLRALLSQGIAVGLGTDGPMSGNTLDVLTQLGLVGKVYKLQARDRTVFPTTELVELGTLGGARALGLEGAIGSIAVGKRADLVLLETRSVNMQPVYDPYGVIAYSANAGNVDTVLVDGRVVVRGKRLVSADFAAIRAEFLGVAAKVRAGAAEVS